MKIFLGLTLLFLLSPTLFAQSVQNPDGVSVIDIGTSVNPYDLSGGARTCLWADNNTKTIAFFHRMGSWTSGIDDRVGVDISTDAGATWRTNIILYSPLGPPAPGNNYGLAAGRYPQGVLYNPPGNTLGANTYTHYFIPTLDGSNPGKNFGPWGGYAWGSRKADTIVAASQNNLPSGSDHLHYMPNALTLAGNKTFVVEPSLVAGIPASYQDTLLLGRGTWNNTSHDFIYSWEKLYFPTECEVKDTKIAFSPDGQTGYISVISNNNTHPLSDSTYFPILYKTTNGGTSWTGPITVDLYGPNGIPQIMNCLSDSIIEASLFDKKTSILQDLHYTVFGHHDLVVDMNGNPHLAAVVTLSSGNHHQFYPRTFTLFEIYSEDGGSTWKAWALDSISQPLMTYGSGTLTLVEDNRVQAARTTDGSKFFFSWSDNTVNFPGAPNIFIRGRNLYSSFYTPVLNVTKFTLAYTQAYMAVMSKIVFSDATWFNIPFVYQAMNPTDMSQGVYYKYINNYKIMLVQFGYPDGIAPNNESEFKVSQNFPNPCQEETSIEVQLIKPSSLMVEIFDLVGKKVRSLPVLEFSRGMNTVKLDLNNIVAGIYFYTVSDGNEIITKRMIVR
ncbi:MAG: T9SS type A sorting domain-containing protein [Bacteroidota bacterium]